VHFVRVRLPVGGGTSSDESARAGPQTAPRACEWVGNHYNMCKGGGHAVAARVEGSGRAALAADASWVAVGMIEHARPRGSGH